MVGTTHLYCDMFDLAPLGVAALVLIRLPHAPSLYFHLAAGGQSVCVHGGKEEGGGGALRRRRSLSGGSPFSSFMPCTQMSGCK